MKKSLHSRSSKHSTVISLIAGVVFSLIGFAIIYPLFGLVSSLFTAAGLFLASVTCFFPVFLKDDRSDDCTIIKDEMLFTGDPAGIYSGNYVPYIPELYENKKAEVKAEAPVRTEHHINSPEPMYQGSYNS